MDTLGNAVLGLVFLGLSTASTFLMFKLWGYPFDHEKLKSAAPPALMFIHRLIGYLYLAIYLYLMAQMLPRMWNYQVEFPARTVAHLMLGMSIGVLLIIKISIVRFFKHMESTMVPLLGTALLFCTALLIGLSVPFALRETLSRQVSGQSVFSNENRARVERLLTAAGLPDSAPLDELASVEALTGGRDVLLRQCVQCHDLRTILMRPRTPENWVKTVTRMAERSQLWDPIAERDQWITSAYLIAITPDLQKSIKYKREEDQHRQQVMIAMEPALEEPAPISPARETKVTLDEPEIDMERASEVFEAICSECHDSGEVAKKPPATAEEIRELVARMVEHGSGGDEESLEQIIYYLTETYAND